MTVMIEDTPRNTLAAWVREAIEAGVAQGAIVSPFSSPSVGNSYKPSGARTIEQLHEVGASVWFDAATHALQMPGVGDFRYYDGWDLWGGDRGDLSNAGLQRDHVSRVLEAQGALSCPPLGPTVLLQATGGRGLEIALRMAQQALAANENSRLTIAGTPAFWGAADDLDTVVGAFAQFDTTGWVLTVARPTTDLPVAASPEEVAGICRTARSLVAFGPVHISHGDLAGLPAVAAGATSVGTGSDSRQRVCAFTSYEARDPSAGGGGWFKRPTMQGLFALLSRGEAERLSNQDAALATRLLPGALHPDGGKEAFLHHAACLSRIIELISGGDFQDRFLALDALYAAALADWPPVAEAAGIASAAALWVAPLRNGLRRYATSEGWL
jgi:hypothetical protein